MIFANVKSITIPEGNVKQIALGSTILWKAVEETSGYTNLLPSATDTDRKTIYGGDYNGDGVNDGYISGYRLSSSGSVSQRANVCCSGFIPCKEGDILRIKGIKPVAGIASYIIAYNNSNTKTNYITISQVNDSSDWSSLSNLHTYENGILTFQLKSEYYGTGFNAIRFCAGVIDSSTVVTINQEITE